MSGVTDMPFRRLVKREGAALVISEMIASQAMVRDVRQAMQKAASFEGEEPAVVQLAGCEPGPMAEAAKLNQDLGAKVIDINMGCPAKKVVNGYSGSALMRDEKAAADIIEATVKAVDVPVTLKMRTGWDDASRNAPNLARIAQECGVQMITVHGRTRCQFYRGKSDWSFISKVKEAVSVPVVGNGDVRCEDDAAEMLKASGADGVMIGRGCYGKPWLPNQIEQFLKTGQRIGPPSLARQKEILLEHVESIYEFYGLESGVRVARKHIGWACKGLPESAEFRSRVNQTAEGNKVLELMTDFYDRCLDREIAEEGQEDVA
ncbi:MAG: tRNA dihydrouridine synthase DusB [bacterium]|nr:tRNA dihydrouridine synthase DusB [bacterium]